MRQTAKNRRCFLLFASFVAVQLFAFFWLWRNAGGGMSSLALWVFLAAALGGLGVVGLMFVRGSSAIAGSAGRLAATMRRVAQGERNVRVDHVEVGELAELALSFNGVLERLDTSYVSRTELEPIVQQRIAELQAHCDRLEVVLNSLGEGVLVVGADRRVVRLNRAAERMTGWTQDEAVGRPVEDIYRPLDPDRRAPKTSPGAVSQGSGHASTRALLTARGGCEFLVAEHASSVCDTRGLPTGEVIIFRDITRERAAEQAVVEAQATLERQIAERTGALQESERRHRGLLANLPGMAYRWVLKSDRWCVGFVSDGSRAILGLEPEALVDGALPYEKLLHPADREYVRKRFLDSLEARRQYVAEYRIQHADGSWLWVLDQGRGIWAPEGELVGFEGYISDVSERKLTDTALRRLSTELAECSGDEFFARLAADLADLLGCDVGFVSKVVSETPPRLRFLGLSVDGRLMPASDYDPSGGATEGSADRRTTLVPKDALVLHPDNCQFREWQISGYAAMPLFNALGHVVGRMGVMSRKPLHNHEQIGPLLQLFSVRAVTEFERMTAEAERHKLESQLRQAQKMESLGTLAGGIAHDFNNILGGVIGFAELLKSESLTPDGAESLQRIEYATRRARDLVRQILTFSRRSEVERQPVSLGDVVDEAAKLLHSTLPAMVELRMQLKPCALVLADATQLHQVVVNLVTNAWQALPSAGGSILVELHEQDVSPEFARLHPELKTGLHAVLRVTDNGKGMSPEVLARIFDPFYTTKAAGKGTGLGLSVVHGIVELHRGAITVESAVGRGTSVQIFLPALPKGELEGASLARDSNPSIPPHRGGHILLVDDEAIIAMSSERILKRAGYSVTALSSPDEAVARLRSHPKEYDLLVTDLSMPGMTGLELASVARAVSPGIGMVLMTGYLDPQLTDRVTAMNIDELLKKPVGGKRLLAAVGHALAAARQRNAG